MVRRAVRGSVSGTTRVGAAVTDEEVINAIRTVPTHHSPIPGNPFRGPTAPQQAFQHLQRFHGIDPAVASNRLHRIKQAAGLGAADDVVIGRTGDVYNAVTGEYLGSLTDRAWGH
jgi:hypothetical protein